MKIKPPRQAFGVIEVGRIDWNTTVVLPIDKAGELATLMAQGQVWSRSTEGSYQRGYYNVDEDGKRPTLPSIEVIDEDEFDRRLEVGLRIVETRKAAAEAARLQEEQEKQQTNAS